MQTRACEIFREPWRMKITASSRSSSTTEMETAIANLLRHARFGAFGRKCGVAEGGSVRLTRPPFEWCYDAGWASRKASRPARSSVLK
ncbi:hypothetical protein GCM10011578_077010 [Streptomyces fuscichromogenes]|uniref:Uncharacterized protein n=1 Tax=Streptomyces fuscichromogenes TaxID=1324013 RepID=A0A917XKD0_9ACTN|nr:hypothetical protein GCM10011578_077010 [Streptomyces fuscichromogenes]